MATVQRDETTTPGAAVRPRDAARESSRPRVGAAHVRAVERRAGLRGALLGAGRTGPSSADATAGGSAGRADGTPGVGRRASVVVRPATAADAPALARLAEHDPGHAPAPPLLVAEQDGAVVAAIGVLDRRVHARAGTHAAIDRLQAEAAERRAALRAARWRRVLRRSPR